MRKPHPRSRNQRRIHRCAQLKRAILLEQLEVREVPAIALVGTELRIDGGELNDLVTVAMGTRGSNQVVATQTQIGNGGQTTESKTFALSSITSISRNVG